MTDLVLALKITADNKGAKPALAETTADLEQMGGAATTAASQLTATSIATDKVGKGATTSAAGTRAFNTSLSQQQAAAVGAAAAQDRLTRAAASYGLTVGQYQQAQRQLPMQITDITTSLVSGMPVYMVAVQQGGQLRDAYGGIGNAARALFTTLRAGVAAINPLTLAIGAVVGTVGALGAAAYASYRELQEYDRALISTGNYAATTAGALADLTERVGEATGEFSESRAAAVELATSGKLAGTVLEDASRAAVNLARLTGAGISSTTADIIKLADAPSEHLAKLNEQYHFLSASTYEQIRALEKQGKTQDAVALSIAELARVTDQRTQEMEARAGWLERAWKAVGDTVAGVWQSMKDVGRDDDEYKLEQARQRLANVERSRGVAGVSGQRAAENIRAEIRALEDKITAARAAAEITADMQRDEEAAIKASQEQEKAAEEARKKAERERESAVRARVAAAERLRNAADAEIAGMQRQIELGEKATNVARTRYEIEHGAYRALDGARQQALLKEAARLDAAEAARKAGDDYKALLEDLQTKEERLTAQMRERMSVLDAARASGAANDDQYTQAAGRIAAASFEKAPKFTGLAPEVGGAAGELAKVAEAEKALKDWHDRQLQMLADRRQQELGVNSQWNEQEKALQKEHSDALAQIQQAQQVASLSMVESVTRQSAELIGQMAGKSSAAYKAMFLVNKAAAIAQALVNTEVAATAALAMGPIFGIPASTMVRALGYMSVGTIAASAIQGVAHDGIGRVPAANEGTWLLKQDEMVLNSTQAENFGVLLDFVSAQQKAVAGGGTAASAGGERSVVINVINQGGEQMEAKVTSRQVVGNEERWEIVLLAKQAMAVDVAENGDFAQLGQQIYGWPRQGR